MASKIIVRDMTEEDMPFVGTCTHIGESQEIDSSSRRRLTWLKWAEGKGARVKVALVDGRHAGFLHLMPVEVCPCGPIGLGIMFIPCLYTVKEFTRMGVGRALVQAAVREAVRQEAEAVATIAYLHDNWFMPAGFFRACGLSICDHGGNTALMWMPLASDAIPPRLVETYYEHRPRPGKVVVELYWNRFCETSDIEAQRVREVAAEFGGVVVLEEHCSEDMTTHCGLAICRAIFVNGREVGWGHEAPKEGLRKAITEALQDMRRGGRE